MTKRIIKTALISGMIFGLPASVFWISQPIREPLAASTSHDRSIPKAAPKASQPLVDSEDIQPSEIEAKQTTVTVQKEAVAETGEVVDPEQPGNTMVFDGVQVTVISRPDESGVVINLSTAEKSATSAANSELQDELFRTKWGWQLYADAQQAANNWKRTEAQ